MKNPQSQTRQSLLPIVLAVGTLLLVLGAMALLAMDRLETARGRSIEQAPQPALLPILVSAGLLVVAIAWFTWLLKEHGLRALLTRIALVAAVVLLIATPIVGWQSFTAGRDLSVTTMLCPMTAAGGSSGSCEEQAVDTIVLLEGEQNDDTWVPDTTTGNLTRAFDNLPSGPWRARIVVDGPQDAVSVSVIAIDGDERPKLASLRPSPDAETGRLRWSGVIAVDAGVDDVRVQFHTSANPAVESARIRFDVRQCPSQTVRSFDAAACEPFTARGSLVRETPTDGERSWRQPYVSLDGTSLEVTNLEARTYSLQPDYTTIEMLTQSTDVLIIPGAMDQVAENSITVPGESSFEITIDESTGELVYTMYVFPTGPTYASSGQFVI